MNNTLKKLPDITWPGPTFDEELSVLVDADYVQDLLSAVHSHLIVFPYHGFPVPGQGQSLPHLFATTTQTYFIKSYYHYNGM